MLTKLSQITAAILLLSAAAFAIQTGDQLWTLKDDARLSKRPAERWVIPTHYNTYSLDLSGMKDVLTTAPMEFTRQAGSQPTVISLPMPNGKFEAFSIEESPVMEPGLAARFPDLKTYRGQGIDDPTATLRFDVVPTGFHAIILRAAGTVFIDPYARGDIQNYVVYSKSSLPKPKDPWTCGFNQSPDNLRLMGLDDLAPFGRVPDAPSVVSGDSLRTYRLALAATGEYTAFWGGTVAGAMAGMVTTMNRVNGVYERDVAIHMNMVANNNLIIYTNAATDPYTNNNGSTMLGQNQTNLDNVIGTANYDIGHVFSTGGGGVATLNSPCNASSKARGVTGSGNPTGDGYDIDYVAHEMGHQFGGYHTFNGTTSSCGGGNRMAAGAYEPGSGVTIMAYAGICGSQDLAPHSIDTFHVKSLEQIVVFRENGGSCGVPTATGNTPPIVSVVGGSTFNIPKGTPFSLTAAGSDANGDTLTYDWQEYDLGPASPPDTDADGNSRPIIRNYLASTSPTRVFPSLQYILNNANVPPATTNGFLTGEILPSITRTMVFQVVARDNRAATGGINTATATVNVDGNSGPFVLTFPNAGGTLTGNSTATVTWNVANTTAAPVNAANVQILLSTDGGNTFPIVLAASTPNDGTEDITVPNTSTSTARVKVQGVGNIFFDISNVNFSITAAPSASATVGGRVTSASGLPVIGAMIVATDPLGVKRVALTNAFGYYRFDNLPTSVQYTFTPTHKRFSFTPQIVTINSSTSTLDFTAL
ncbi:MAG: carboxypeptidase regulatory-like domain-containing protein [Acidobacteria bacterium]|nr:carboxypeptidase regulatory-like domain-containing protein [Acidobacteriota bacterium]